MKKEFVKFDEWQKLNLRTAKILKAEDIEGADKLYKLTIDVGDFGKKTICAGIKNHYKKEKLIGKNIIFLENLEPRSIKGILSEGMVLAAEDDDGRVSLLTSEKDVGSGSKVR